MASTADRILSALDNAKRALDDDELAALLGVRRQVINQVCRSLELQGRLKRRVSVGSKIVNLLVGVVPPSVDEPVPRPPGADGLLTEDEVKAAVRDHLQAQGYRVTVAWGHQRGIDIEAMRPANRILIEAKGEVTLQPQQVNYFIGALGELVQRLADPNARYGLALPDNPQYRGLVARLPALARQRLSLIVFLVKRTDGGLVVTEE
jgi:hypothetical protein